LVTLCHSEGRPFPGANLFSINMFMPEVTAFCYTFGENCGLGYLSHPIYTMKEVRSDALFSRNERAYKLWDEVLKYSTGQTSLF
jgi:hypothetical protein